MRWLVLLIAIVAAGCGTDCGDECECSPPPTEGEIAADVERVVALARCFACGLAQHELEHSDKHERGQLCGWCSTSSSPLNPQWHESSRLAIERLEAEGFEVRRYSRYVASNFNFEIVVKPKDRSRIRKLCEECPAPHTEGCYL